MPEGYTIEEAKKVVEDLGKSVKALHDADKERGDELKKLGDASGEIKQKLDKINDAVDKFEKAKERLDLLETAVKRGFSQQKDSAGNPMTDEMQAYKAGFRNFLTKGMEDGLRELEQKALAVQSDPDGGYHVTPDQSGRMLQRIFETSPIRSVAAVQSISTDALEGMIDDDEASGEWVGETDARTDEKTPKMGKWRIPVHEMATRPKATQKLLDDASVDVEGWLMNKVSDKFRRMENAAFVTGNGSAKPRGFLTYPDYSAAQKTADWGLQAVEQLETETASVIDFDDLINMQEALKNDYEMNSMWAFNKRTLRDLRKIKDNDGNYIWEVSVKVGVPSSILGRGYIRFEDMPDVADGALPLVLADWSQFYQIVDRIGVRVLRDPYSFKPFVEFYTTRRVGGDVMNFDAGKILKIKAA